MGTDRYYGIVRTAAERERAFELRAAVFCEEQGISREEEFDELDDAATHLVAVEDGELIATCRLLHDGEVCQLGRLAVAAGQRRGGTGRALIAAAERRARARGATEILVHAQRAVERFYADSGYVAEGETFLEAEIPHVAMRKRVGDG